MDWNSSILWGIISLIGSLIFSFIFYKLSIKKPKIICSINSHILNIDGSDKINNLDIAYFKNHNKKLIKTTIKIELSSNNIIDKNDFSKLSPFCIKVKGEFFVKNIDSIITYNSNPDNLIKPIIKNKSTILLDLDYLSEEDNITLVLLHTGALKVDGKLKRGCIINIDSFESTSSSIDSILCCYGTICLYVFYNTYFNTSNASLIISCILAISLIILLPIRILKYLLCLSHACEKCKIDFE